MAVGFVVGKSSSVYLVVSVLDRNMISIAWGLLGEHGVVEDRGNGMDLQFFLIHVERSLAVVCIYEVAPAVVEAVGIHMPGGRTLDQLVKIEEFVFSFLAGRRNNITRRRDSPGPLFGEMSVFGGDDNLGAVQGVEIESLWVWHSGNAVLVDARRQWSVDTTFEQCLCNDGNICPQHLVYLVSNIHHKHGEIVTSEDAAA